MCSFDVVSLFTNIPLDETLQMCVNAMNSGDYDIQSSINSDTMTKLLELCSKESVFMFEGKMYQQKDGVAMGSPLGPLLANIFLCCSEVRWLDDCPISFKPLYYRRYVDDTFVLFRKPEHASEFLTYLNSCHPNIRFTCDRENQGTLSFLDVLVANRDCFTTSVYRKP